MKIGSANLKVASGEGLPWVVPCPLSEQGPAPAGKNQVGIWIMIFSPT